MSEPTNPAETEGCVSKPVARVLFLYDDDDLFRG